MIAPRSAARLLVLTAAALAAGTDIAAAQTNPLQPIADRFYPAEHLSPANASERHSCAEVLRAGPDGSPTLVIAGYTDRSNGWVRVLRRNGEGGFEVAYEPPDGWALAGTRCDIRVEDMDFDGTTEALVFFLGVRASTAWAFRWDGTTLVNLTPTETVNGRLTSMLLSPVVYDLEHKDSLRVVAARAIERPGPGQRPRTAAFVYRLEPSGFVVDKSIVAIMGFRADVDPRGNLRPFRLVQDSLPPYTLRVVNGDRAGKNRVTSATILVNEQEVAGPALVNAGAEFTSVVLSSLFTDNHLTATLTGPPDGTIIVVIEDSTKR